MDFNVEAANWDNERRITRSKTIADEILRSIRIEKHHTAMEFGCGTGLVSFNLHDRFKHITLVDTSSGMIDRLNQKILQSGALNMTARQLDINRDTTSLDKYDVIYTSMALHHILDIAATIGHLYDLLNPGGYLCIVELVEDDGSFHKQEKDFTGHNGFDPVKLEKVLARIGFSSVASHVFYNDYKLIEDAKVKYCLFLMTGRK